MTVYVFSVALAFVLAIPPTLWAHGIAGKRFFPTTFAVDDPFISDEFSMLYNYIRMPGEAGGPPVDSSALSVEYSKRITPNFGISLGEQYQHLHAVGDGSVSGF